MGVGLELVYFCALAVHVVVVVGVSEWTMEWTDGGWNGISAGQLSK